MGYPHVLAALCMCADFNGQVTFVFCAACVIAQPTVHACVEDNLCACGVICVCVHVPMWESVCVCVAIYMPVCQITRVCVFTVPCVCMDFCARVRVCSYRMPVGRRPCICM